MRPVSCQGRARECSFGVFGAWLGVYDESGIRWMTEGLWQGRHVSDPFGCSAVALCVFRGVCDANWTTVCLCPEKDM
jgi:hypothetical protein